MSQDVYRKLSEVQPALLPGLLMTIYKNSRQCALFTSLIELQKDSTALCNTWLTTDTALSLRSTGLDVQILIVRICYEGTVNRTNFPSSKKVTVYNYNMIP